MLVFVLLFAIPVMILVATAIFEWLWNITIPEIFGLNSITFWQAFRLLIISGMLFGTGTFIRFGLGQ